MYGNLKKIKSVKAMYLLKMLLITDGPVSIERIRDELWPDWDTELAMKNFYFLLHQLRKYLDAKDAVLFKHGLCSLDRDLYDTDVRQFNASVTRARECVEQKEYESGIASYEEAIRLVRGGLFEGDVLEPILFSKKVHMERMLYNVCLDFGKLLIKTRKYEDAVNVLSRSLENSFADEDAYKLLMLAHYISGNGRQAVRVFETLKSRLKEEMNIEPHAMTTKLLQRIKAGEKLDLLAEV
jgi:DNA-binding SARP family transcriptional activator